MSTTIKNKRVRENSVPKKIAFQDRIPFSNNKKSNLPSSHNPIYQREVRIRCKYCNRSRIFDGLWQYYKHCNHNHETETKYKEHVMSLADLVIGGTL